MRATAARRRSTAPIDEPGQRGRPSSCQSSRDRFARCRPAPSPPMRREPLSAAHPTSPAPTTHHAEHRCASPRSRHRDPPLDGRVAAGVDAGRVEQSLRGEGSSTPCLSDTAAAAGVRAAHRRQRVLRRGRVRAGHGRPGRDRPAGQRRRRGRATVRKALRELSFQLSGAQLGITITALLTGYLAEPALAQLFAPLLEPCSAAPPSGVAHVARAGPRHAAVDALRRAGAEERGARPADAGGAGHRRPDAHLLPDCSAG